MYHCITPQTSKAIVNTYFFVAWSREVSSRTSEADETMELTRGNEASDTRQIQNPDNERSHEEIGEASK
jgi:hypothetical protein